MLGRAAAVHTSQGETNMIIDSHVHIGGFSSYSNLGNEIKTTEDLAAFRTRYPELYAARLTDTPVDNSRDLIGDMDLHGINMAVIQASPGYISNEFVAASAAAWPERLIPILRIGHDQEAAGYLKDPHAARDAAVNEVVAGIEQLHMRGVGEVFPRAFTNEIHPERIADDLRPIMAAIARYKVPMQFPTAWSQFPGGLYYGDPIYVDEIAPEFPSMPIILTKLGRGIPYYFDMVMTVALRNASVYVDTVGTTGEHLRIAVDKLGADRVMFGTDWSATWRWVRQPRPLYEMRLKVLDDAKLSEEEREQVLWRTAARLYGLPSDRAGFQSSDG